MNIKKSILIRVRVAFIGVVIFALCVAAKIGHIQIVEGDKWKRMADEIMFDFKKVKATRGTFIRTMEVFSLPRFLSIVWQWIRHTQAKNCSTRISIRYLSACRNTSAIDRKKIINE
ncbi:MAG: hypothetical protein WDO15_22795 [Bacteroidota bacterium]